MIRKIWNHNHLSVCSVCFKTEQGIRIATSTGFKFSKYLITEEKVLRTKQVITDVQLVFFEADGKTVRKEFVFSYAQFKHFMFKGFNERALGCLAYRIDDDEFDKIPSLQIDADRRYQIGTPLMSIGYQSDENNLALKSGVLSSFLNVKGNSCMQFEMSMFPSFSGAPIFNAETGKFVGVAGARIAKINESYQRMMDLISANLDMLTESEGKVSLNNIDPIQVLKVSQTQIKYLAIEMFKNTPIAFGYALEAYQLQEQLLKLGSGNIKKVGKGINVEVPNPSN
jgi:hypothetical protein